MKMGQIISFWIGCVLIFKVNFVSTRSLKDELTVTYNQKVALDKFRNIVGWKLPHAYMKEDIYLIKWLRAQNYDLKQAEEMLMQNLKWRKEYKMDKIQLEDWSDMEAEYSYHSDSFDQHGEPRNTILYFNAGDWNLRRASVIGHLPRLTRYLDKILEDVTSQLREMQNRGSNVTRAVLIGNVDNFSLALHSCAPCVGRFLQFLLSYENHFPGTIDKIILINAPPLFEIVLQITRRTLSQDTQEAMHVFTKNKPQWQKYLFGFIDRNQLPEEYGGTKKD